MPCIIMKKTIAKVITRSIITSSLIISSIVLHAENFTVKVKFDNNEPAGYAYVYLNNKIITTADSVGVALIPIDTINSGDTISASFVGYRNESVCITKKIKQKSECDIVLVRNYTLDEVVVTTNVDAETLYKKYAAKTPFYHYGSINDLKYKYTIKRNNGVVSSGDGDLSLIYVYKPIAKDNRRPIKGAYSYPDANVKDETSFEKQLIASVHHNISSTSQYYNSMFKGLYGRAKTLKYNGISNNCHVFTSVTINKKSKTQIVCFFEKETRLLSHFELSMIDYDDNGNVVIAKESKFDVDRKRLNIIANEYFITNIKEVTRYKDIELTTEIDINNRKWKFDKNLPWGIVPKIQLLLDSDYSDKKY